MSFYKNRATSIYKLSRTGYQFQGKFLLERGANLESRAVHTHPKTTQVPPRVLRSLGSRYIHTSYSPSRVSLMLHAIELTQSVGSCNWTSVMTSSDSTLLTSAFLREVFGLGPYTWVNDCKGVVNISLMWQFSPVCHNSLGTRLVYLTLIHCFVVPLFQHQEKRHAES